MSEQLSVDIIRSDGGTQPRVIMNSLVILEYAEAMSDGAAFPPVVAFFDGADYWLADGFHRLNAARQAQLETINADVRQGTREDAEWYSFAANKDNGLHRSNEDKQNAIKRALQHPKGVELSDREIARHVGVDHKTVVTCRVNLSGEIPQIDARVVVRNGSSYVMNTAPIGGGNAWQANNPPMRDAAFEYIPFVPEEETPTNGNGDHWFNRPSLQTMHPSHRVLHSNSNTGGSNEWYTPAHLVDAARETMGGIDLDPASCTYANTTIRATTFYDEGMDGLTQPWYGRMWMNPPYGKDDETNRSNQERWLDRLISEYHEQDELQAVLIVNAVTDRKWFNRLWDYPICFTGRVYFYNEQIARGSPTHGSAVVYFGKNVDRFVAAYRPHGRIVLPCGWYSEVVR
jgi:hypothetical protein